MDSTLATHGTDGLVNGGGGAGGAVDMQQDQGAMAIPVNDVGEPDSGGQQPLPPQAAAGAATSYDDLFPSLPASATPAATSAAPIGEWNRKPLMFASSTVTQV